MYQNFFVRESLVGKVWYRRHRHKEEGRFPARPNAFLERKFEIWVSAERFITFPPTLIVHISYCTPAAGFRNFRKDILVPIRKGYSHVKKKHIGKSRRLFRSGACPMFLEQVFFRTHLRLKLIAAPPPPPQPRYSIFNLSASPLFFSTNLCS